jgi:hypothetical protein
VWSFFFLLIVLLGFQMVLTWLDSVELEDDRDATLEDAAEQFCKSIGVVFTRVIESDLW